MSELQIRKTEGGGKGHLLLCIVLIALFKLLSMGLFSSDYQNRLFIPFVLNFLSDPLKNPWQTFFESGIPNGFPYAGGMLLIQSIGGEVIRFFSISSSFWTSFWFKFPTFLLDLISLFVLLKLCPKAKLSIVLFYYASPFVFYGAYMHGQLDVVPMTFFLLSIFFLSQKTSSQHLAFGAFFYAIALLCKLHLLAAMPIVYLYLVKRDGLFKGIVFLVFTLLILLLGFYPCFSQGFIQGVLLNSEQSVLTQVYFSFASVRVYIPILAVFFVYFVAFRCRFINRELFFNLIGIVFALFLALTPPMPGWYIWIASFLAIFFANSNLARSKNSIFYVALCVLYLIYFVFFHQRSLVDLYFLGESWMFLKVNNQTIANTVFTLLSGTLLFVIYMMFQSGVTSNGFYRRRGAPFAIGIAGDSASGKSTMLEILSKILGEQNMLNIEGDGDHKWERQDANWKRITALNPKANYLYRQAEDLKRLCSDISVVRTDYDHTSGKFISSGRLTSKRYIVLSGLHALYLPQIRKLLSLKIYMDTDEALRRFWKVRRDMVMRGHTKEDVLRSISERAADALRYIYPQKAMADIVIRYYAASLKEEADFEPSLSARATVVSSISVEPLVDRLKSIGVDIHFDYSEDLCHQVVDINGEGLESVEIPFLKIAEEIVPQLEEITQESLKEDIPALEKILSLLILLCISYRLHEEA